MRVGIYVQAAKAEEKTGISSHVIGLVNALLSEHTDFEFFLYYQHDIFSKDDFSWLTTLGNVKKRPLLFPKSWVEDRPRLWWNLYLPLYLEVLVKIHPKITLQPNNHDFHYFH